MTLTNNTNSHLYPAFGFRTCTAGIPVQEGKYTCTIKANHGKLMFNHYAYDLQTGCWDAAPEEESTCVTIQEGESRTLVFHCGEHDGQLDEVFISNASAFKGADFSCVWERMDSDAHIQHEHTSSFVPQMWQIA